MTQKHFIFDFDGTIADSMWVIISIYEELFHKKVTPEQVEHIRGLSALQVIKELGVPLWKATPLMTKGKRMMRARLHEVSVFEGIPEMLAELQQKGHSLRIMSSNSEITVREFLKEHNLAQYFTEVIGGVGLFGKAPVLRKTIRTHALPIEDCFYIGDEARDIEAAKKAHVPMIAVGWGYNSPALLQSLAPTYFVTKPISIVGVAA